MLSGLLALAISAVFAGAAIYISVAEHPARLMLPDQALLAQWQPAYKRGFAMQASLAIAAFIFGAIAWWHTGQVGFIIGAAVMIANWPWTLLMMMPTNNALMAMEPASVPAGARGLLLKWGRRHAVRSGLGSAGTLVFLWACLTR